MSSSTTRSGKRPANWGEFYKNGQPAEVIVIDDDTPPPTEVHTSKRHHLDTGTAMTGYTVSHHLPHPGSSRVMGSASSLHHGSSNVVLAPLTSTLPSTSTGGGRVTRSANKRIQPLAGGSMQGSINDGLGSMPITGYATDHHYGYPVASYSSIGQSSLSAYAPPQRPHSPPPPRSNQNAAPPVKRRKKIQPPEPAFVPAPTTHTYSHYQQAPLPGTTREVPVVIPPYDDKDGHYIVVPDADFTSRFKIIRLLGQGTFGKVIQCYDRETGLFCAIKIIRAVQKYRDASKIEIRVLNTLKRNDPTNSFKCLHLTDCFDYRNHVCMVFDLLGQSIYDWLKDNSFCPFPSNQIQHFARQLLTSVAFLHRLRLIHTDLKPENILLANGDFKVHSYRKSQSRRVLINPEIRLIDFGSATFQDEHHSAVVSTRHYRAPEIILGLGWSFPCDIWSVGCILVEFLTGEALFQTHDNLEHLAMMQAVLGPIPDLLIERANKASQKYFLNGKLDYPNAGTTRNSRKYVKALKPLRQYVPVVGTRPDSFGFASQFVDLLSRLLAYDPADRITASQALRHPYFNYTLDEGGYVVDVAKPVSGISTPNGVNSSHTLSRSSSTHAPPSNHTGMNGASSIATGSRAINGAYGNGLHRGSPGARQPNGHLGASLSQMSHNGHMDRGINLGHVVGPDGGVDSGRYMSNHHPGP